MEHVVDYHVIAIDPEEAIERALFAAGDKHAGITLDAVKRRFPNHVYPIWRVGIAGGVVTEIACADEGAFGSKSRPVASGPE